MKKFLSFLFLKTFCSHNYHLINMIEMKSEVDILVENGKTPNTWNSTKRKIITDYKCSHCNKLKRLTAVTK